MGLRRFVVSVIVALALGIPASTAFGPATIAAQESCAFVLGFRTLHDLIPTIVGDCVTNEFHNPVQGDTLQVTTNGLLVWRKADNWTAFTDGYRTWVNGPFGLQTRLNQERFPWEQDDQTYDVQVFFSRHPESDDDFTEVFPVSRTVNPEGQMVARATLAALIEGPTPAEQAQGYFSELGEMLSGPSNCDGADFRLTIEDGLATVQFCRVVTSAGIGQDARVTSQVETTLEQFDTVQEVRLLTRDGGCLFDASGMDLCLQE